MEQLKEDRQTWLLPEPYLKPSFYLLQYRRHLTFRPQILLRLNPGLWQLAVRTANKYQYLFVLLLIYSFSCIKILNILFFTLIRGLKLSKNAIFRYLGYSRRFEGLNYSIFWIRFRLCSPAGLALKGSG
jgi:hypothetical protein